MVRRGCWPAGTVVTSLTEMASALATAGSASAQSRAPTARDPARNLASCMTRNLPPPESSALQIQGRRQIVDHDEQRRSANQPDETATGPVPAFRRRDVGALFVLRHARLPD